MSRRLRKTVQVVGLALLAAAVLEELNKPPAEREWHGQVWGFIPYEFRPPTLERVRERWWSPDDPRILMPHVFGVGWSLNVGRLVRLLRL